ncbi:MAG: hypothetical protein ABI868_01690 [Acidobacteriota bacterium]
MCIKSLSPEVRADRRSRVVHTLLAIGSALLISLPSAAFAQAQTACGPEVKEEVAKLVASLEGATDAAKVATEYDIYKAFQYCGEQDKVLVPTTFAAAARECGASVSNLGSLFYEQMSCVGYDPQRRQFAAPITIKQPFGFGGAPLPGSREHVLHCVADAGGTLVPVGRDSVHLANSPDQRPTWQFAVIVNANQNLTTIYPMSGQTRRARSILSWALTPTDCNYTPIWGNALNYRIRLDQ